MSTISTAAQAATTSNGFSERDEQTSRGGGGGGDDYDDDELAAAINEDDADEARDRYVRFSMQRMRRSMGAVIPFADAGESPSRSPASSFETTSTRTSPFLAASPLAVSSTIDLIDDYEEEGEENGHGGAAAALDDDDDDDNQRATNGAAVSIEMVGCRNLQRRSIDSKFFMST